MDILTETKLKFPRLKRVVLTNFSLFKLIPEITVIFSDGVSCLAGANGLGKSTFIAAINYALTGRVPDPARKYESVNEYYRFTENFSGKFFEGRISETDRESSQIEVEFTIDQTVFRVVRGMFEPNQIRELEIRENDGINETPASFTPGDLQQKYAEKITECIGLDKFEQFVFLQLFVCTFDERRHLIFWDDPVLQQILFLTFGFNAEIAKRADELWRSSNKEDSIARNRNYQATEMKKQLQQLIQEAKKEKGVDDDLRTHHEQLVEVADVARQKKGALELQISDAKLKRADLSSRYSSLQNEYNSLFERRVKAKSGLRYHPLIVQSINEHRCGLCGQEGSDNIEFLKTNIEGGVCPLCGGSLEVEPLTPLIDGLKKIESQMQDIKNILAETDIKIERVKSENSIINDELSKAINALEEFETQNDKVMWAKDPTQGDLEGIIKSYKKQIEAFQRQRDEARERRNRIRDELAELQRRLSDQYYQVENSFVPIFKELSHAFLGLDLDIRMETRQGQIGLAVEVEGQVRRSLNELSESQRFFVDIALRMALSQFLSDEKAKASMFIDTPEGSLDAAYESRAGEMFARFVESGHPIIMTANINTSQLLRRLAKRCGTEKMQLLRMIEWTELSEVQEQEEDTFEQAYKLIQRALEGDEQ